MYSPKIDEQYIPRLFRLSQKHKVHMTTLVNKIIEREIIKAEALERLGYMMDIVRDQK